MRRIYTEKTVQMTDVIGEYLPVSEQSFNYEGPMALCDVTTTTILADTKIIYGKLVDQISTKAIILNLFSDGSKFGRPINDIGVRGYVFDARMAQNYNQGYRLEGTTGVGAAGVTPTVNATVNLKYYNVPQIITGQAENLTKGNERAFMQARAKQAKFDTLDAMSRVNVVIAGAERGGVLAKVTAPAAGSFTADNATNLPGALYLKKGMPIDTGATGGGANSITNAVITAINYSTRLVTVPGTAVAGDSVYITGEAPQTVGAFPMTAEGLISLISDVTPIQGIDPAVAGNQAWVSFVKDNAAVPLTPALLMEQKQFTYNRGSVEPDMYLVPSAQINQYVAVATTTLRFDVTWPQSSVGKKALDLGFTVFSFAGIAMIEDKDLRADRIYCGASEMMNKWEALPLGLADDGAGTWTRVFGANGIADAMGALLRWYHQFGIQQRSAWSVYKNYTIPTAFSTNPTNF